MGRFEHCDYRVVEQLWVLVILFGAYALVDGLFAVLAGIRGVGGRRWCRS